MKHKLLFTASGIATLWWLIMINMTTPDEIGPFGVLLFFASVYVSLLGLVYAVLVAAHRLMRAVAAPWSRKAVMRSIKRYYFASVIALAPVIMLGAQSISSDQLWSVGGLVILFEIIALIYIQRRF